jgi:hypothetical protein
LAPTLSDTILRSTWFRGSAIRTTAGRKPLTPLGSGGDRGSWRRKVAAFGNSSVTAKPVCQKKVRLILPLHTVQSSWRDGEANREAAGRMQSGIEVPAAGRSRKMNGRRPTMGTTRRRLTSSSDFGDRGLLVGFVCDARTEKIWGRDGSICLPELADLSKPSVHLPVSRSGCRLRI